MFSNWFPFVTGCIYSFLCIYHNLSINLLNVGHWGCFQFGAIMNKVALNINCKPSCGQMFSFLLAKYLGVGLMGHIVGVYFACIL